MMQNIIHPLNRANSDDVLMIAAPRAKDIQVIINYHSTIKIIIMITLHRIPLIIMFIDIVSPISLISLIYLSLLDCRHLCGQERCLICNA